MFMEVARQSRTLAATKTFFTDKYFQITNNTPHYRWTEQIA